MEWYEWLLVILAVLAFLAYKGYRAATGASEEEGASGHESLPRWGTSSRESRKISNAGDHTPDGILTCPRCGGTQFTSKRSAGAKALLIPTVGVGALLAPKTRVRCVTCRKVFIRG
jgi:hypothetical protein